VPPERSQEASAGHHKCRTAAGGTRDCKPGADQGLGPENAVDSSGDLRSGGLRCFDFPYQVKRKRKCLPHAVNLIMDLGPAEMLGPAGFRNRSSRTAFTVSPDGSTVIFVGVRDRTSMLYRRPLSEAAAVAIPGTEGADYPFFSPDGQWVGFAAASKLKKVALGGGPPIDLCDLSGRIWGASWGSAGVIVFANAELWTVPDSGGKPAMLVDRPQGVVASPAMLPDGQTVLVTKRPSVSWEEAHVDSIHIATKERKTLLTNAADARYSSTGHLVFIRNAALLAVAFDAARAEISGSPVPLVAGVMQATNAGNGNDETGMG
jgi:hypothetical protein